MKKTLIAFAAIGFAGTAFAQSPATFTDLGTILSTGAVYDTADKVQVINGFAINQVRWYRFNFLGTAGTANYLDIDITTVGQVGATTSPIDTYIGLFNSTGNRIAEDDDSGWGLMSALTFGTTSPVRTTTLSGPNSLGGPIPANGFDGPLTAGTYWLAVTRFSASMDANNWGVTLGGDDNLTSTTNQVQLNFRTDAVPEPMTMTVLALGAAALVRRRRSKKA